VDERRGGFASAGGEWSVVVRGDGGEGADGRRRENLYRKWLTFDGVFGGACEALEDPLSLHAE
jgi:hypothetical protein